MKRGLFAAAVFLSAFLIFWLEPLAARLLLPHLGGGPAIWNTCLVFFQAALLAGYLYAHCLRRIGAASRQGVVHLLLLAVAMLFSPRLLAEVSPPWLEHPSLWLFFKLSGTVGIPFLLLSATAPLLQSWFAAATREDPYPLYAASNAGSLLALILFPALLERSFSLSEQIALWDAAFLGAFTLSSVAAWLARGAPVEAVGRASQEGKVPLGLWFLLAFLPSSLLLGVTHHISTDIAAMPLLWVVPLALYLVTFVIAFSSARVNLRSTARLGVLLLIPLCSWMAAEARASVAIWLPLALHLIAFFLLALALHLRLASLRPAGSGLTSFYLTLAAGGACGGAFNAILAPLLFNQVWEYPLALAVTPLLLPLREHSNRAADDVRVRDRLADLLYPLSVAALFLVSDRCLEYAGVSPGTGRTILTLGLPAVACLFFLDRPLRLALGLAFLLGAGSTYRFADQDVLMRSRSFFGVYTVAAESNGWVRKFVHGSIIHGRQRLDPGHEEEPLAYYHPTGPLGSTYRAFAARDSVSPVAAVGLGIGSLASYCEAGRQMTFFEIDPLVERIARDTTLFSFLARSRGDVDIVLGDARLTLGREQRRFGLIVLDAFSGDAVPVHLLTREALTMYLERLDEDGLLAFHVSNRYLDLAPVLINLSGALDLVCLAQGDYDEKTLIRHPGKMSSLWVVLARRPEHLGGLLEDDRWIRMKARPEERIWTDDHADALSTFRW